MAGRPRWLWPHGLFASKDGTDQRILNWTAIFDEIADFEGNTRGISGGVGALVSKVSTPIAVTDRINTAAESPPQQGLQGSRVPAAILPIRPGCRLTRTRC